MAKCVQCGQEVSLLSRDIFTGVCTNCRANANRTATLGCGTLIAIGIVVALFSGGDNDKIDRELQGLRKDVSELKKAIQAETTEIRQLSDRLPPALPPLPKAGEVKAKE